MTDLRQAHAHECGTCSLCCKLLGIGALDKQSGVWCAKCDPPNGCTIYQSRPQECRDFSCLWRETASMGEEWKPTRSRIVLYLIDDGARLIAHVNPSTPHAWRQEPYYQQLKAWSRKWVKTGPKVVVRIERRLIVILPDEDVDLGVVDKGEAIFIGEEMTPTGPRSVARKVTVAGNSRPAADGAGA